MNTQTKRKSFPLFIILAVLILAIIIASVYVLFSNRQVASLIDGFLDKDKYVETGSDVMVDLRQLDYPVENITTKPGEEETDWNTESYAHLLENPFQLSKNHPLSTFAADVDTASYANIRRFLKDEMMPYPDSVRIEEMLNYFHYDYELPSPNSNSPFSVNMRVLQTPWNNETKLLHIALATEELVETQRPASNIVLLIDISGSMNAPNKHGLVQRAFLQLIENLGANDRVSIVTYAASEAVVLDGGSSDNKIEIMNKIADLHVGGGTHGSAGIVKAYELAQKHFIPDGNNRVILATDGDLNVGITSEGELIRLIEKQKESNVFLSVLGFGDGNLKDDKMESIANHGNGEYYYIDSVQEAKKVLHEELGSTLHTVAKDVKFQVDFNPEHIKAYRLIGYENRIMANQDFADDSKDGGEIGAGHQVTVLYEIATSDSNYEIPDVKSKYVEEKETSGSSEELLFLKIRYKEPKGQNSQELEFPLVTDKHDNADESSILASCIAEFGMLLKDSEYKGNSTYANVLERLESIKSDDPYVAELASLIRQAESLSQLNNTLTTTTTLQLRQMSQSY